MVKLGAGLSDYLLEYFRAVGSKACWLLWLPDSAFCNILCYRVTYTLVCELAGGRARLTWHQYLTTESSPVSLCTWNPSTPCSCLSTLLLYHTEDLRSTDKLHRFHHSQERLWKMLLVPMYMLLGLRRKICIRCLKQSRIPYTATVRDAEVPWSPSIHAPGCELYANVVFMWLPAAMLDMEIPHIDCHRTLSDWDIT